MKLENYISGIEFLKEISFCFQLIYNSFCPKKLLTEHRQIKSLKTNMEYFF